MIDCECQNIDNVKKKISCYRIGGDTREHGIKKQLLLKSSNHMTSFKL